MGRNRRYVSTAVAGVVLAVAFFSYGYLTHRNKLFPQRQLASLWHRLTDDRPARSRQWTKVGASTDGETGRRSLLALPYLQGTQEPPPESGVVVHDRERTQPGWNLVLSAHRSAAYVMDPEGTFLHEWSLDLERLDLGISWSREDLELDFFRKVHLLPDGDLLGIFENGLLVKLDRRSDVLWHLDVGSHHDLFVGEDGRIHVLTRRDVVLPWLKPNAPVVEDSISVLSPDGELLREVSIPVALRDSPYAPVFEHLRKRGDLLHTNAIELLPAGALLESEVWLVSIPRADMVAAIDTATGTVAWALSFLWRRQHKPTLVGSNLLVFDNQGASPHSRVLEVDPLTQEVVWSYEGSAERPFYSKCCGYVQRLANGNTLVTETESGRAFEVREDGEIVWEWFNTFRHTDGGEYIAWLFQVVRLGEQEVQWLEAAPAEAGRAG